LSFISKKRHVVCGRLTGSTIEELLLLLFLSQGASGYGYC